MSKKVSMKALMTAYTDFVMEDGESGHEVFDFFYPACLTSDIPDLQPKVAEQISKMFPNLARLPKVKAYADRMGVSVEASCARILRLAVFEYGEEVVLD